MNLVNDYRAALHDLTDQHPGTADLAAIMNAGRRRRRLRRNLAAGGAVTALSVAALSVAALQGPDLEVAPDPVASSPDYHDFVSGSDVDEALQATVAAHLTGLAAADQVYPSDWNHLGPDPDPIPLTQAANATEWQAWYDATGYDDVVVRMSMDVPGWPLAPQCSEIRPTEGAPPCSVTTLPGGGQVARYGFESQQPPHPYSFMTVRTNADGSFVIVSEHVVADSWAQATARRSVTDDQARELVDDPAMTFPAPVVRPADPEGP